MSDEIEKARALIDAAHRSDPRREGDAAYEVRYAERLEGWVRRLIPAPTEALLLAARAQHLERWAISRESYPEGRGGYLRWRVAVHARQGERALALLTEAGCDDALAARVSTLVAKAVPRDDAEAQALEDAACLVFLETELLDFMNDYPREKTIDVIRKTWKKMSASGKSAALALSLPEEVAAVVREAVS